MIKLELIQGKVEIENVSKKTKILARNKVELKTDGKYHYEIKTIGDSWVILNVDGKDVVLRPNSRLRIADKESGKVRAKRGETKLWLGRKWASITSMFGNEEDVDMVSGNAVAGVRG